VLIRRFGSMVAGRVCVGAGRVAGGVAVSRIGVGWNVPVGVHGMGWKGVGVGEALGAAVTSTNPGSAAAGADAPHPARRNPARKVRWISLLIC
jgi:hypothetical protein